ncbi:unnamed protein product, partial [Prorocentrum cordatum]
VAARWWGEFGDDSHLERRIFSANITKWGPTVMSWLRRDGAQQPRDVYALQETRLARRELDSTGHELQKAGFSAVFAAARASDRSGTGTCGGAGVRVKGRLKATWHRRQGPRAAVSGATTSDAHSWHHDACNMCGWTPVTLRMRGSQLLIISIYLGLSHSTTRGVNSRQLTSLVAFLSAAHARAPWLLCGDSDRPCEDMVQSGWTTALGATAYVGLDSDQRACFLGDALPSNIDCALVGDGGQRLARGIQPVHDVPWKPRIGLDIAIVADVDSDLSRRLQLPKAHMAEDSSVVDVTVAPNSEFNGDMDRAGARRAPRQMPPLDRLNARARETDAINVDDTWEVANMMHHGPTSTAPPYAQNCAAYRVDPDSADQLGATCRHFISALETFYCMTYHIPLE